MTLTLSEAASEDVLLWTSASHTTKAPFDPGSDSTITWQAGASIPATIWVGDIQGSLKVGDISFTLSETDPGDGGGSVPVVSHSTTKPATAVKVSIIAETNPNGAVLGPNGRHRGLTRNWLVGQMVGLDAVVEAPAEWLPDISYFWDVPGNAYQSYDVKYSGENAPTSAVASQLTSDTDYTLLPEIAFYWESLDASGDAFDPRTVALSVNVQSSTISSSTSFNVYSPHFNLSSMYVGQATVFVPKPTGLADLQFSHKEGQDWDKHGMELTGSVTQPSGFPTGGSWNFVQMAEAGLGYTSVNGQSFVGSTNNVLGLDRVYPSAFLGRKFARIHDHGGWHPSVSDRERSQNGRGRSGGAASNHSILYTRHSMRECT